MPELQYMPFYCRDWLYDTQDLSPEGYMAYHRLLCHMWMSRENTLPDDHKTLKNRAGISPQKWPYVWAEIEKFFYVENSQVGNQTLDKHRGKARSRYQARSDAGKASALKRKGQRSTNRATNEARTKTKLSKDSARVPREGEYIDFLRKKSEPIKKGHSFAANTTTAAEARAMLKHEIVTLDQLKAVGLNI